MINVTTYQITEDEYKQHRIDMYKRYMNSLAVRQKEWQNKKGYSPKMDAWCDKNIREIVRKQIQGMLNKI